MVVGAKRGERRCEEKREVKDAGEWNLERLGLEIRDAGNRVGRAIGNARRVTLFDKPRTDKEKEKRSPWNRTLPFSVIGWPARLGRSRDCGC
ncbi:hypothetical protein MTO96_010187 [Rhipicephalus appendiculatus]